MYPRRNLRIRVAFLSPEMLPIHSCRDVHGKRFPPKRALHQTVAMFRQKRVQQQPLVLIANLRVPLAQVVLGRASRITPQERVQQCIVVQVSMEVLMVRLWLRRPLPARV